jgi:Xaa-Pro dipeptidase
MRKAPFADFPLSEYKSRMARFQDAMDEQNVDGMFLTTREAIEFISGFQTIAMTYPFKQFAVVVPRDGDPTLVIDILHRPNAANTSWVENLKVWGEKGMNHIDALEQALREAGLANKKVGAELGPETRLNMTILDYEALKKRLPKMKVVDGSGITRHIRMVKSKEELQRIRRACQITVESFGAAFEGLRDGMTERAFLNSIEMEMLERGADCGYNRVEAVVHVCTGPQRKGQYAAVPVDRKIRKGDFARIDGCAQYKHYLCDITRSFYFGTKVDSTRQHRMDALIKAQEAIPKFARPGMKSSELVDEVIRVFKEEGVADQIVRWVTPRTGLKYIIGHNFGFVIHEDPDIYEGGTDVWKENMVFASELIIGEFEEENDYLITKNGCELLTPLQHKASFAEGEPWKIG